MSVTFVKFETFFSYLFFFHLSRDGHTFISVWTDQTLKDPIPRPVVPICGVLANSGAQRASAVDGKKST